jgi:MHS family proline/betaine transporter-like MFS transporter
MNVAHTTKSQWRLITAVTWGNVLAWYDIYLYAFWAQIIAKAFFNFQHPMHNLISTFVIFGMGFVVRPIGAIFFGRLGDVIGRRKTFILTIVLTTIPTFFIGCIPSYAQIGIYAPILLGILRLLQAFPSAGESPGTFCYLYENSNENNQKFITSWGAFGNQIGAILCVIEFFLMETFCSEAFLVVWGWRISFWTGGLIGLLGIYLRRKLHETPSFRQLQEHNEVRRTHLKVVLNKYRGMILKGTAYGVVNAATFYLIASFVPHNIKDFFGLHLATNTLITLSILVLTTILLPVFGLMGDRFKCKPIMITCTLLIIAMLPCVYIAINQMQLIHLAIITLLFIVPLTCITALIPYLLARLFPTSVRYTGMSLSFNLADGIIGGFTPAISFQLIHYTQNPAGFIWYILICALISLFAYMKIKE